MVRLKEANIGSTIAGFTYFNSTMVRLKVFELLFGFLLFLFQFHYGTIKRDSIAGGWQGLVLFQFLYGTIKSFNSWPSII